MSSSSHSTVGKMQSSYSTQIGEVNTSIMDKTKPSPTRRRVAAGFALLSLLSSAEAPHLSLRLLFSFQLWRPLGGRGWNEIICLHLTPCPESISSFVALSKAEQQPPQWCTQRRPPHGHPSGRGRRCEAAADISVKSGVMLFSKSQPWLLHLPYTPEQYRQWCFSLCFQDQICNNCELLVLSGILSVSENQDVLHGFGNIFTYVNRLKKKTQEGSFALLVFTLGSQ